ncbi:COX5A isoform 4 [Pan troglodytes]|uniref:Cytochrome c oxidase subunit 5A, mitochondrial n=2 Tax=Pan troglodytes TaxID=9598 RepID=A0A6D2WBQ9_PANTR|nr:COX5A isoform 4 [Pan troglodytes]
MLGAALRRCAVAATTRAGPRGLLHSARTPGPAAAIQSVRCYSHGSQETDEEFDARWVTYFNKPDIDAWELRKGINTLVTYDMVPEPKIIDAALRACRRLNDFASTVRILEAVKMGFPKDLLTLLLECEQLPGNTDDNILPYLNKFSFIEYQAM